MHKNFWSHDHTCDLQIDLMIDLLAPSAIRRSKLKKAFLANFDLMKKVQSGDWLIIRNFNLMRNAKFHQSYDQQIFWPPVLISWNSISWSWVQNLARDITFLQMSWLQKYFKRWHFKSQIFCNLAVIVGIVSHLNFEDTYSIPGRGLVLNF